MIGERIVGYVARPIHCTNPGAVVRAICRYDGTTNTINASYNISSVTDNGNGDFVWIPRSILNLGSFSLATGMSIVVGSATDGHYVSVLAGGLGTSIETITQTDAGTNADVVENIVVILDAGVSGGDAI